MVYRLSKSVDTLEETLMAKSTSKQSSAEVEKRSNAHVGGSLIKGATLTLATVLISFVECCLDISVAKLGSRVVMPRR
mgnify:FL=1